MARTGRPKADKPFDHKVSITAVNHRCRRKAYEE